MEPNINYGSVAATISDMIRSSGWADIRLAVVEMTAGVALELLENWGVECIGWTKERQPIFAPLSYDQASILSNLEQVGYGVAVFEAGALEDDHQRSYFHGVSDDWYGNADGEELVNEVLKGAGLSATSEREGVLLEAAHIVTQDRNTSYGEPEDSFAKVAGYWSHYLGLDISPADVGLMMVLLKVARAEANPKRDNFVDMAGYAACAYEVAA